MRIIKWSCASSLLGELFVGLLTVRVWPGCRPWPWILVLLTIPNWFGSTGSSEEWWSGENSPLSAATKPTWRRRDGLRCVFLVALRNWNSTKISRKKCSLFLPAELCALWISLVSNLACASLQHPKPNLGVLTTVHPSFRCVLSFNPQTVMKCSPQPPDICGTADIGDLKLLSAHVFLSSFWDFAWE